MLNAFRHLRHSHLGGISKDGRDVPVLNAFRHLRYSHVNGWRLINWLNSRAQRLSASDTSSFLIVKDLSFHTPYMLEEAISHLRELPRGSGARWRLRSLSQTARPDMHPSFGGRTQGLFITQTVNSGDRFRHVSPVDPFG